MSIGPASVDMVNDLDLTIVPPLQTPTELNVRRWNVGRLPVNRHVHCPPDF